MMNMTIATWIRDAILFGLRDQFMPFEFKTHPFAHQLATLESSADLTDFAVFWEQGCLDVQTQLLTPHGWRSVAEITEVDEVLQWDAVTRSSSFAKPTAFVASPCEWMYHLRHRYGLDQMLSREHTVPILDRYSGAVRDFTAQQLVDDLQVGPSVWRRLPTRHHFTSWGPGVGLSLPQWRLQLAVMADGSFPANAPGTRHCIVRLKKRRKIERLRLLLAEAGLEHRETESAGYTNFTFYAPRREKLLTLEHVLGMTEEECEATAAELLLWDGNQRNQFYTTHESVADAAQLVFSLMGHTTHRSSSSDLWTVSFRSGNTHRVVRAANVTIERPSDGMKYCVGVPSGYLVARRSGHIFITGNTGKSKLTIDTLVHQYREGRVDAMLVVAPSGVELNWITDELPTHLPDSVLAETRMLAYRTRKAATKWHQAELSQLIHHKGLSILAITYDAFVTKGAKEFVFRLMKARRLFYVLDEAHNIKTPKAQRTKSILASAKYGVTRRILTGTPVAQGPFDIYSQMKFLDPQFWARHNLGNFTAFKQHFGVWEKGYNGAQGREFDVLVRYKNIEELERILSGHSSRVLKEDVLDLPPKLYSKRRFELSPEQERVYAQLKEEFLAEWTVGGESCTECGGRGSFDGVLPDGREYEQTCESCSGTGQRVVHSDASLAIVRLLRLQQVACGYLPTGDEMEIRPLGERNPRLDSLVETAEALPHQAIIWARFQRDVDLIMDALGRRAVRYDGVITDEEAARSKEVFKAGGAQFFVGNPAKGATGLTLTEAKTMIYYSNSFKLIDRLQSEDRAHRIGQTESVNYIDMIADRTVDEDIVEALRAKLEIASLVTGDRLKEWL